MSVVKEIIKIENNNLCFGNYLLEEKNKVDDFVFENDKYKVKTYNKITRLEKNDKLVMETIPGSAIKNFNMSEKEISFSVEGLDDTQITFDLQANKNYEIEIDNVLIGTEKSNAFGKLGFSVNLSDTPKNIKIKLVD